jgi:hypothetical protein
VAAVHDVAFPLFFLRIIKHPKVFREAQPSLLKFSKVIMCPYSNQE